MSEVAMETKNDSMGLVKKQITIENDVWRIIPTEDR